MDRFLIKQAMTIICYGDSNTYGYDPRSYLGDRYTDGVCWVDQVREQTGCHVRNLGVNGREIPNTPFQTNTVLRLLDAYAPPAAGQAQLWVMLGTNDLLAEPWRTAEEAAQKMRRFLQALLRHPACLAGNVSVLLIAPPKMQQGTWVTEPKLLETSRQLGAAYQEIAEGLKINFFDASALDLPVCYDGVHLTEEGHRLLAQNLRKSMTHDSILFTGG